MKNFSTFLTITLTLLTFTTLFAQPMNDNIGFATVVTHTSSWCSADAAYTTMGATADGSAAGCWNI